MSVQNNLKPYTKVMINEQIDLTQAIIKFLKMLVNVNGDKLSIPCLLKINIKDYPIFKLQQLY